MYDKFYDVVLPQPLVWKDVIGFEGRYKVSNYGDIKSLERYEPVKRQDGVRMRKVRERIMRKQFDKYGVPVVGLSIEAKVTHWSIHNFMLEAFYPNKVYLESKDGDLSNTLLWNMELVDNHECKYLHLDELKESDLTKELLEECFTYHKDGYLVWEKRPKEHFSDLPKYRVFNTINNGKVAGYFNKRTDSKREGFGYWRVGLTLGNCLGHFKMHRLIFLMHHGYLPKIVDHRDRDTSNNKIENLRESDVSNNGGNSSISVSNTSGYKGVSTIKGRNKYSSSIECKGNTFFIGNYDLDEAAAAYNIVARLLFGEHAALNDTKFPEGKVTKHGKFWKTTYPLLLDGSYDWIKNRKR